MTIELFRLLQFLSVVFCAACIWKAVNATKVLKRQSNFRDMSLGHETMARRTSDKVYTNLLIKMPVFINYKSVKNGARQGAIHWLLQQHNNWTWTFETDDKLSSGINKCFGLQLCEVSCIFFENYKSYKEIPQIYQSLLVHVILNINFLFVVIQIYIICIHEKSQNNNI